MNWLGMHVGSPFRERTRCQAARDSSDKRLGHLKAAIDYWHDAVGAWSGAKPIEPGKQNLS